ncbi:MAG: alpha,alpha-trehalose-phosphate synthase (UDP-forming) [Phenylobacterium sp.]|uniref:alpha,alpha-trehalose-phosphate synthase (UDP-forming) n=1 Tax=Phenylobacterium sp. TaxID=1871053 RepID=UPI002727F8BD|nr:alpha,alpha-trehalose-phosphate synthase (UDP-forming) [Phenylobacterium sp.]MDO8910719.1 alpha,alpha-trehalose-phosphate synthase (UDP-forming) [Phenylobacterium sp.]MDO9248247.1 alpha,alpha-trehalose-phosphate synthase (UDP-forming) [Phenylobacterium sp.]MDP2012088.1 alpha,alpha-trehalose-phosphate synthase (UDP-forming) [Phenylobacterium sp.]MDP3100927.1 alpha,alpha-trehalose-phosphate synthase (UDP-forming) [Phenylobacterium sp.]MDP3632282.1 alpha,alpha-trehalose-phosphate synthase (UDP
MSRLIVVSNRVNAPTGKGDETVGGLAMALSAALREYSGLWFGWSGKTTEKFTGELNVERCDGVTVATLDLEETDLNEYYNGYANKTLWPLFHYRQDLTAYDRSYGEGYERVNQRFAETLAPLIEPDDLIWVHDYHLIPLARELRKLGVKNRIGFYLHIPWPAHQLMVTLPGHQKLVQSLFDYDLVGFQTADYRQAFEEYVLTEAKGVMVGSDLRAFGRTVKVGAFPIGVDAAEFAEMAKSERAWRTYNVMMAHTAFRSLIIGVDRLDYSKGLEERFAGFEHFLAHNPDVRREVLFLQIAPVSREGVEAYQEIRARLDSLSGRINGEFADIDWNPVRYVNKTYRRDELAGVYRAARVALVTPLRDGMNLVAKEFVAAQNPDDPGVLILSRFAGAADQLKQALMVNPNSPEEIAEALKRALAMDLSERVARWAQMFENVTREDVNAWRDAYVGALSDVRETHTALAS